LSPASLVASGASPKAVMATNGVLAVRDVSRLLGEAGPNESHAFRDPHKDLGRFLHGEGFFVTSTESLLF